MILQLKERMQNELKTSGTFLVTRKIFQAKRICKNHPVKNKKENLLTSAEVKLKRQAGHYFKILNPFCTAFSLNTGLRSQQLSYTLRSLSPRIHKVTEREVDQNPHSKERSPQQKRAKWVQQACHLWKKKICEKVLYKKACNLFFW